MRQVPAEIQEAMVFVFAAAGDPRPGLAGGFQMQVEDRGGVGLDELQQVVQEIVEDGNAQSGAAERRTAPSGPAVPQLYADVDRVKAKSWACR